MLPSYDFVFHSLPSAFFGVALGSSGYISSLKQDSGATFQLLGVSLAAGTLLQGVVLSHYAVFSFGWNLTAPRRFVSAKPFLCWSVFHDSSACVRAPFAFAFRCCASPWAVLLRFVSLWLALARFGSLCLRFVCLNFALSRLNLHYFAFARFASLCLAMACCASLCLAMARYGSLCLALGLSEVC